jgi:hypothetical protein
MDSYQSDYGKVYTMSMARLIAPQFLEALVTTA